LPETNITKCPSIKLAVLAQSNNKEMFMDGEKRVNIKQGLTVKIVLKQDQKSGILTKGVVKDILTKSPAHPHGIKVRLTSGDVGRVKEICGWI
jgi:uncharacterized repeat protein (TIGR03833 family)